MWPPITKELLINEVIKGELELNDEQKNFWDLIKINPEKWLEKTHGQDSDGFWIVGILGKQIIWYNDIEEGFNISEYDKYGEILKYGCSQVELNWSIIALMDKIKANRYI